MNRDVSAASQEQRLHEVIAQYILAEEEGRGPDRNQVLASHPGLAAELQRFFDDHDRMRQAAAPLRAADTPALGGSETIVLGTSPASAVLTPGQLFGDYELLEEIARGGMGVVYRARQISLNRVVALKMILSGQFAGESEVRRFKAEAEAAANLDHSNIVPIYEVGEHKGQHYFTMKLIDGGSLTRPGGGLAEQRRAATLMATVARAVHYAHQRGVLHRDLKPANILLDEQGQPHVSDFGLAKRVQGGGELTRTGNIVGTPSYMAPEQARGEKGVSTSADVYSLGAILYELLAGRPPFQADSPMETLLQVLEQEPQRPHTLNPNTDPDMETICLKCLDKDPGRRYASAEGLAGDLERWVAGEPIVARRASAWERAVKWMKRRPAAAALAAVSSASVLGLLVLAGFLWQNAELRAHAVEDLNDARDLVEEQERLADEKRDEVERLRKIAEREQANAVAARASARRTLFAADMQFTRAAWETDDVPRLLDLLERYRPRAGASDLRGFEWHYLRRLAHEARASIAAHPQPKKPAADDPFDMRPVLLAVSPDGKTLASTSAGDPIKLWKLPSGEYAGNLPRPKGALLSLAFAPDGKGLLMMTERTPGKKPAGASFQEIGQVQEGKLQPSLRWLAGGLAERVLTLDRQQPGNPGPFDFTQIAVPMSLITAGPETLATLMATPLPLKGSLLSPICMTVSPDRTTLALGGISTPFPFMPPQQQQEGVIVLWDLNADKPAGVLKGHPGMVHLLAFSPDGKTLVVCNFDSSIRLWDMETRKERTILKGHASLVTTLAFSADGKQLVSGSADGVVKLWETVAGQVRRTFKGHQTSVTSAVLTPDGRTVCSADADGTVKVWNAEAEQGPVRIKGFERSVKALGFAQDGKLLAADQGGTVMACDPVTGQVRRKVQLKTAHSSCAVFSPDGLAAAFGTFDGNVVVSDTEAGKERFSSKVPKGLLYALAFSPDGKVLAGATGALRKSGRVILWDAATGKERLDFEAHGNHARCLAFSPDGKMLATGSRDRTLKVWDATSGKELLSFKELPGSAEAVAFSPDGRRLVYAAGDTLAFREMPGGRELLSIRGYSHEAAHLAFSPDGKRLASAAAEGRLGKGGGVKIWDAETGLEVLTLGGASSVVSAMAFSPDGRRLAASILDGSPYNFLAFPTGQTAIWDATPLPGQ